MLERLEDYLKKVLPHYAQFNDDTWKWEITFDELNEMMQFYLDKIGKNRATEDNDSKDKEQ